MVCGLWLVARCVLFVVGCLLFVVCCVVCVLLVVCGLWFVVRCALCVVCWRLFVGCCLLFGVRCLFVCCGSIVARCLCLVFDVLF